MNFVLTPIVKVRTQSGEAGELEAVSSILFAIPEPACGASVRCRSTMHSPSGTSCYRSPVKVNAGIKDPEVHLSLGVEIPGNRWTNERGRRSAGVKPAWSGV